MHILVLGAAGMVGRKLSDRLIRDGRLGNGDITAMTLQDVVAPAQPPNPGFPIDTVTCDFAVPGAAEKLVAHRPDVIFHLAAIVSGEAELDFDKGYRINLDGTRMLLDAIRLGPGDDETEVTAVQVREVVARLIAAGHWHQGDPAILDRIGAQTVLDAPPS